MKIRYEYDVVLQDGAVYYADTRQEAREKSLATKQRLYSVSMSCKNNVKFDKEEIKWNN